MLCSDGLTDVVDDSDIKATLDSDQNPQMAARQLVQLAVEHKAKDDVTCVVFQVEPDLPKPSVQNTDGFLERIKRFMGVSPAAPNQPLPRRNS